MTDNNSSKENKNIVKGNLKHGIQIGDEIQTEFEIEPIKRMGQLFDAEEQADVKYPMQFQAAVIGQQLKRIGDFTGPFTLQIMGSLKPADYNLLRKAQLQLDEGYDLGNVSEVG